jgi:hypothetical protein
MKGLKWSDDEAHKFRTLKAVRKDPLDLVSSGVDTYPGVQKFSA